MPVQFKDYYETLGVSRDASADEIKKSFRKLARQHHPDMAKEKQKAAAEAKFKEINEAYEVLSDPEKRKKYDTLGADWNRPGGFQPPPGWQGGGGAPGGGEYHFEGTGFSDFFEMFFGGGGGRKPGGARRAGGFGGFPGAGSPPPPARGSDAEADILVSLEEALHGAQRKISLRRADSSKAETYNVRIPAGVREGQRIRLAGQGGAGAGGAGDLYLRVKIAQHPDFKVEGANLIHELDLPAWKAVLGGEVQVPTLTGHAKLKIPAGTQNGQRFRLKQHGLSADGNRGDLYVVAAIEVPRKITAKEEALWKQIAELEGESGP